MKKLLSLVLVIVLAGAETAVLSDQSLTAVSRTAACEKYSIDGSNYFRLRELAPMWAFP